MQALYLILAFGAGFGVSLLFLIISSKKQKDDKNKRINKLENKILEKEEEVKNFIIKNSSLKIENENLQNQLKKNEDKIIKYEQVFLENNEKINNFTSENSKIKEEVKQQGLNLEEKAKTIQELKEDLNKKAEIIEENNEKINNFTSENSEVKKENENLHKQIQKHEETIAIYKKELSENSELINNFTSENSKMKEEIKQQKLSFDEKMQLLKEAKEQVKLEYKQITAELFKKSNDDFTEEGKKSLLELLNPVKTQLTDFRKKIEDVYRTDTKERQNLLSEINNLKNLNQKITQEANNLTAALKGDNKKQGNWGEFKLQRLLEEAGLEKGLQYETQQNYTDESNKRLIPDVIIKMPDEKVVIIDSKVSLKDYEQYSSAENSVQKEIFLKNHLNSIKNHVKNLSSKQYQDINKIKAFDLVLMFIAVEPAYLTAIQADRAIFTDALDKRILVVSPSMLLVTLRMIKELWRYDAQNKNIEKIATRGGLLYDKLVDMVKSFEDVGKNLDKAKKSYDTAFDRLKTGRGNAINQANELKKLGIKAKKSFEQNLIDEATSMVSLPSSDI